MTQTTIASLCACAPIIPVLVVEDVAHARPLAQALVSGGLPVLEVTLRTKAALEVIAEMAKVDGAITGAGTVITPNDVRDAKAAGAEFCVSPGATATLVKACKDENMPLLPGAATASEAMALYEQGFEILKFFPAEASGGAPALKALGGPLPQITFCPTGGISPENAGSYLSLQNVVCAGGSWVAPKALLDAQDWDSIENLARAAYEDFKDLTV